MHPSFTGRREIDTAVFLPGDLRCRVSLRSTLQPSDRTGADGQVHGCLQEGGELWKKPLELFALLYTSNSRQAWNTQTTLIKFDYNNKCLKKKIKKKKEVILHILFTMISFMYNSNSNMIVIILKLQ